MSLRSQRRMAARVLGVGLNRVWIDPDEAEEVESAITKEEIRRLIHEGVIRKRPPVGISRGRKRAFREKRSRGRRRGPGSRKGSKAEAKHEWINRIRSIRRRLRKLRDRRMLSRKDYRRLFTMAKGGSFRSVAHLNEFVQARKLVKER